MGDEAGSQIGEEFGMGGLLALHAEVAGGGGEGATEMPVPNAIDDDARGERSGVSENPFAEFEPSGALLEAAVALR